MSNESVGIPVIRTEAIKNEADIPASERSKISLHLMVKNGASVVGRLMDNVGPYVHEVVAVLNDCDDETSSILEEKCKILGIPYVPLPVTRDNHPELYILDEAATYEVGQPLTEEKFGGPFTGQPILADWATARNIGWSRCTGKWRLFMDADDVMLDPECLPGLCKLLEEQGVELAVSSYLYGVDPEGRPFASSLRERLALNVPRIRWGKPIHECLFGTTRISHLKDNLVVRDMRDSAGKDVRIPGRSFKILYHRARSKDWEISPRLMADLLQEVKPAAGEPTMMRFAEAILDRYMEEASWPEERGWVYAVVGEMRERVGNIDGAIAAYEDSLACHPGSKTAFRLCRAVFKKAVDLKGKIEACAACGEVVSYCPLCNERMLELPKLWRDSIAAYQQGVANKAHHQALDDGPLFEEMEAIHVAGAYMELGDMKAALEFAERASAAFPESSPISVMVVEIKKVIGAGKKYEPLEASNISEFCPTCGYLKGDEPPKPCDDAFHG